MLMVHGFVSQVSEGTVSTVYDCVACGSLLYVLIIYFVRGYVYVCLCIHAYIYACLYRVFLSKSIFLYFCCSLYEESAENLHQLSDKLPAPGNTITVCDHLYFPIFMNEC